MNPQQQRQPTTEELRAQIVSMMEQLGVPVPPKPDMEMFRGRTPEEVHELTHSAQTQTLATNVEALAAIVIEAQDALTDSDEDHDEILEKIDKVLNAVSITSLSTSKTVLDLQEIEEQLREADAPMGGHYL